MCMHEYLICKHNDKSMSSSAHRACLDFRVFLGSASQWGLLRRPGPEEHPEKRATYRHPERAQKAEPGAPQTQALGRRAYEAFLSRPGINPNLPHSFTHSLSLSFSLSLSLSLSLSFSLLPSFNYNEFYCLMQIIGAKSRVQN